MMKRMWTGTLLSSHCAAAPLALRYRHVDQVCQRLHAGPDMLLLLPGCLPDVVGPSSACIQHVDRARHRPDQRLPCTGDRVQVLSRNLQTGKLGHIRVSHVKHKDVLQTSVGMDENFGAHSAGLEPGDGLQLLPLHCMQL